MLYELTCTATRPRAERARSPTPSPGSPTTSAAPAQWRRSRSSVVSPEVPPAGETNLPPANDSRAAPAWEGLRRNPRPGGAMTVNLCRTLERAAAPVRRPHRRRRPRTAASPIASSSGASRRSTAGFARLGVEDGDVVAIMMLNSHAHLELLVRAPARRLRDQRPQHPPRARPSWSSSSPTRGAVALIVDDAFARGRRRAGRGAATRVRLLIHAGDGARPTARSPTTR